LVDKEDKQVKRHSIYLLVALFGLIATDSLFAADAQETLTYGQILKNRWEMTDAQFAEYQKRLIGQQVRWSGKLSDVTVDGWWFLGTSYTARIIVAGYEPSVFCTVSSEAAQRLQKNTTYSFSGNIKDIDSFLRIHVTLQDVTFQYGTQPADFRLP
jgi:hypothetical protein